MKKRHCKLIAGDYEEVKELGNGAFGQVVLGKDDHGNEVAIKVVNKDWIAKLDKVRHVFREKNLLNEMNH